MKKSLIAAIVFLLGVFIIFASPVLFKGKIPFPGDAMIGLYYPFREIYVATNPNGIAYKNSLITDPFRQQYPWREMSVNLLKSGQMPLWNPYSFTGTPLLANFQTAIFYPLNIIFLVLPFIQGWTLQILLQTILLCFFTFIYLRFLKLHILSQIFGAVTISFCGFVVAWYEWNTVIQTFLWLPLLLLSIEKIFIYQGRNRFIWSLIFVFAWVASFFAGHTQVFFYISLMAFSYIVLKAIRHKERLKILSLFAVLFIVFLALSFIQWYPFLHFVELSGRALDQQSWQKDGWFIPWQNLVQYLVPDFFGNPTTLNYWGVWNYAEFVGYIGIIPLFFAFLGVTNLKNWYVKFFSAWAIVGLLFALPSFISFLPYQLSLPIISTSQPTRLNSLIDFSLIMLSAFGLNLFLKEKGKKIYIPVCLMVIFTGIVLYFTFATHLIPASYISVTKHNLYLPLGLILISLASILLSHFFVKQKYISLVAIILILITVFDLLRFSSKFLPFTNTAYVYPSTGVIKYLQSNIGYYRYTTDNNMIMAPDISVMYELQSIDGYDPLYLKKYGQLVALNIGYKNYRTKLPFNRIVINEPLTPKLRNFLGVKYVLSLNNNLQAPGLRKVYSDGYTYIYQNSDVLPRAFMVDNIVNAKSNNGDLLDTLKVNLLQTAVISDSEYKNQIISKGNVRIVTYSPNKIVLITQNKNSGFVVLTDSYYPTWHVYIDGKESKIYQTDYNYRGVLVPAGYHTLEYKVSLL